MTRNIKTEKVKFSLLRVQDLLEFICSQKIESKMHNLSWKKVAYAISENVGNSLIYPVKFSLKGEDHD